MIKYRYMVGGFMLGLSVNTLKLIAVITMLIDHIGAFLFNSSSIM